MLQVRALPALLAASFVATLAIQTYRLDDAPFGVDETSTLWMARNALSDGVVPDHGLVSSFGTFQPPGLIWLVAPAVAIGGDPLPVQLWFAVLNGAALMLLVWAVYRHAGIRAAAIAAAILACNVPSAMATGWLWHTSLYAAAASILLAALLRLRRDGSRWWAAALGAIPIGYALIHMSGFAFAVLVIPALLLSGRRLGQLVLPLATGMLVAGALWVPYLHFEAAHNWSDVVTLSGIPSANPLDRVGQLLGLMGVWGVDRREDIGLMWMVPLLLGAALTIQWRMRSPLAFAAAAVIVAGNLTAMAGQRDVTAATYNNLGTKRAAAAGVVVPPLAIDHSWVPRISARYLPSDPPYEVGADVRYLRMVDSQ